MNAVQAAFALAALTSAGLGVAVLVRRPRGWREATFALGMAGFLAETIAGWVLVDLLEAPDDRILGLRILLTCQLFVPLAWAVFVASVLGPGRPRSSRSITLTLSGAGVLALTMSALVWARLPMVPSDVSAPFYAVRLDSAGLYVVMVQLVGTVAILAALEFCLRAANRDTRWRVKYLVLGLGGAFLVRFYLLSHVLLFQVLLAAYLATQAATLVFANALMAASVVRGPLGSAGLTVSRTVVYRSVVVAALGIYLFAVGALGWVLNRLGLSEELFWGSLLVFVAAAGASVVILSEHARWRLIRLISLHVYRDKYDYRAQWINFTRRLGSTVTFDDLAPQLLAATTEAIGSAKGVLYLSTSSDRYQLGAALEVNPPAILEPDTVLAQRAHMISDPTTLEAEERPEWFPQAQVLVPLTWQGSLTGLLVVAGERSGARYSVEDLQFLATVGVQITAAIVTTRLSETVARSREFEAFHRLTSFVIHDLKNALSSLTLLSQNALQHFDDPEFQRDAIMTLSKTAERMRKLLGRFTAAAGTEQLTFQAFDLAGMLEERIAPLARVAHVKLTLDLRPATVVGDVEALERVFQNLVRNAIDALEGGGDLTLRCGVAGSSVTCEVADSGCGISSEFLRQSMFVPFRSTKKGGWGIGLYHARQIVQAHGGRIDVQSEEGHGTTFTVTLPSTSARGQGSPA